MVTTGKMTDSYAATFAFDELDYALEALETCAKGEYDSSMDLQLQELQQLATTFRKAASTGLARDDRELHRARDDRMFRIVTLQRN